MAIDLSSLTQTIQSKFPDLRLEFVEHNDATNRSYPVDMEYSSVKYIDKDRVVFDGKLQVAGNPFETGTIEYNFNAGAFNRVYYSEKTTLCRRMNRRGHMIVHNPEIVNPLLAFLSTYMDGEKKNIFIPFLYRPFNFYGEDLLGTVTLVVFTMTGMSIVGLEQVKLNGFIDVNNERIKAKGILWDLRKDKVYYQQSGHKYYLEIDNRNIELWKDLSASIHKTMYGSFENEANHS